VHGYVFRLGDCLNQLDDIAISRIVGDNGVDNAADAMVCENIRKIDDILSREREFLAFAIVKHAEVAV
jgi:hypothetical protein